MVGNLAHHHSSMATGCKYNTALENSTIVVKLVVHDGGMFVTTSVVTHWKGFSYTTMPG